MQEVELQKRVKVQNNKIIGMGYEPRPHAVYPISAPQIQLNNYNNIIAVSLSLQLTFNNTLFLVGHGGLLLVYSINAVSRAQPRLRRSFVGGAGHDACSIAALHAECACLCNDHYQFIGVLAN